MASALVQVGPRAAPEKQQTQRALRAPLRSRARPGLQDQRAVFGFGGAGVSEGVLPAEDDKTGDGGVTLIELADGVTVEEVKAKTKAKLAIAPGLKEKVA